MAGSVTYKIDPKTQRMLEEISKAKANLETQSRIVFQVILNTLNITDDSKVTVAPDYSTLTVESLEPTAPIPELSTGPLKSGN